MQKKYIAVWFAFFGLWVWIADPKPSDAKKVSTPPNFCTLIKTSPPDRQPEGIIQEAHRQCLKERDSAGLAHVSLSLAAQSNCPDAVVVANEALHISRVEPTVHLALAVAKACVLSQQVATRLAGEPQRCEESSLSEIFEALARGVLSSPAAPTARLAIRNIEHLALFCRDEQRTMLALHDTLMTLAPDPDSCVAQLHGETTRAVRDGGSGGVMGLTGLVLRCALADTLAGRSLLPVGVIRAQAYRYLVEMGAKSSSCLSDATADKDGCTLAARVLIRYSGRLAQTPQNLGMLLADLEEVAGRGGLNIPAVLLEASNAFPLWSAGATHSSDVLKALEQLRAAVMPHRKRVAAALLLMKLDLIRAFATPGTPEQRVELIYHALVAFAGPSLQAPLKSWKEEVRTVARVGLKEADSCKHADEALRVFTEIDRCLSADPPCSPWAQFRNYTTATAEDTVEGQRSAKHIRPIKAKE